MVLTLSTLDTRSKTPSIKPAHTRLCMNKLRLSGILSIALASSVSSASAAEQSAFARVWCESLHFSQGHYAGETLDLSTIDGVPNGELVPYDGKSLASGFTLDFSGMPIYGTIFVGLPPFTDNDGDGFDDFYQTAQAVYATTSGTYETEVSTGTVTATWNRGQQSKDGNCVLNLVDSIYGVLGGFSHSFELMEYTGPLLYTPGKTTVSNRFELTQTGSPKQQLKGRFVLSKNPADRYNDLHLPSGTWTNSAWGDVRLLETDIKRETPWLTNYYGYLDFEDGDPRTAAPDFLYWTISIDDLNDTNKNGIPDFSDDPVVQPPRLAIAINGTSLKLRIEGEKGRTHLLQESSSLLPGAWKPVSTFVLTNDSQEISIPVPQENRFWRAVAQ